MSADEETIPSDAETVTEPTGVPGEDEPDEPESVSPFLDVTNTPDGRIQVTAGWAGAEEIAAMPVNVVVGPARAEQAVALALGWYLDTIGGLAQQAAAEDGEAEP